MITGVGLSSRIRRHRLTAVHAGQHDVEQRDVRRPLAERVQAGQPVGGHVDREPVALQRELGRLADHVVVLDQQHSHRDRTSTNVVPFHWYSTNVCSVGQHGSSSRAQLVADHVTLDARSLPEHEVTSPRPATPSSRVGGSVARSYT